MIHRFPIDPRDLSREEPVTFSGPAGTLEGRWRPPKPGVAPRGVVVVAHPHPAHGGTMLNKVVFHIARTLNHDRDLASLRFNFRGVEGSDGRFDGGKGESHDVVAAWEEGRRRAPGLPLVAAGFSFGAAMTLRAAARPAGEAPRVLVLIGAPLDLYPPPDPLPEGLPLIVVHGERDAFTPPARVRTFVEAWPGPSALRVEPGADHFLEGHLVEAARFISDGVRRRL